LKNGAENAGHENAYCCEECSETDLHLTEHVTEHIPQFPSSVYGVY